MASAISCTAGVISQIPQGFLRAKRDQKQRKQGLMQAKPSIVLVDSIMLRPTGFEPATDAAAARSASAERQFNVLRT